MTMALIATAFSSESFARLCDFNEDAFNQEQMVCDISRDGTTTKKCVQNEVANSVTGTPDITYSISKFGWMRYQGQNQLCGLTADECKSAAEKEIGAQLFKDECGQISVVKSVSYQHSTRNQDGKLQVTKDSNGNKVKGTIKASQD